jgi:hypothetical protein
MNPSIAPTSFAWLVWPSALFRTHDLDASFDPLADSPRRRPDQHIAQGEKRTDEHSNQAAEQGVWCLQRCPDDGLGIIRIAQETLAQDPAQLLLTRVRVLACVRSGLGQHLPG